ncbi:porin family protein [Solirubrum puertoriconensis]|uniref:Outer membrane protein beta-barrel domain-containing protein n=1 Tax=Solirubrum puertoriconensis TaxID=1751427 RepID=A0A9X0L351_SOLP1|nr:porin family protein [Solirubrum puertoriconensis]KUG06125.1 hypothetical protein ASU33_01795 [Solirubrum puertoriconensis]
MKQNTVALAALLLLGTLPAAAQTPAVRWGVKGGVNIARLAEGFDETSDNYTFDKAGPHLGAMLEYSLGQRWALQPEVLVSWQGSGYNQLTFSLGPAPIQEEAVRKVRLTYLNVPVLAKLRLGQVFSVQAGPQAGVLLSGRLKGRLSSSEEVDRSVTDAYKRLDVGLTGGIAASFQPGLQLSARYYYGLLDVARSNPDPADFAYGGYQRVVQLSVGYLLPAKAAK